MNLIEFTGWLGAALLLLAYGLVSAGKISSASAAFQWLNISGAAGIALNSGVNGAYPSAVLNIVWIAIGVFALRRAVRPVNPPQS